MYRQLNKQVSALDASLTIAFFIGALLLIAEIYIYEHTFIDVYLPMAIWLISGIAIGLVTHKLVVKHVKVSLSWYMFICVISFGSMILYGFMASNFYYAKPTSSATYIQKITETGHLSGRNPVPYVVVKYNHKTKQLMFSVDTLLQNFKTVQFTVQKGYWGFDVVKEQRLIR